MPVSATYIIQTKSKRFGRISCAYHVYGPCGFQRHLAHFSDWTVFTRSSRVHSCLRWHGIRLLLNAISMHAQLRLQHTEPVRQDMQL